MPYQAEINRAHPGCFLFLLDQSGSMEEPMQGGKTKAAFLAEVLNRTLMEIAARCTKADGVRDWFDIGIIRYGADQVSSGFAGLLGEEVLHPVSRIAANPLRVERRREKAEGAGGELYEKESVYPVWFVPVCHGSTPMRAAFARACQVAGQWCDDHPLSYPPTVFHVSDGRSTDGDPEGEAGILRELHTDDGQVQLFNLHLDTESGAEVIFPDGDAGLPDEFARMLFRVSSPFPPHLAQRAGQLGFRVTGASRFFIYKASMDFVVKFFEMGTRPAALR